MDDVGANVEAGTFELTKYYNKVTSNTRLAVSIVAVIILFALLFSILA